MSNSKTRVLPRHVDSRNKVGPFYWKDFWFKIIPLILLLFYLFTKFPSPFTFFFFIVLAIAWSGLFAEFQSRETGLMIVKEILTYKKNGNIYFERSTINNAFKFTSVRIEKSKKQKRV